MSDVSVDVVADQDAGGGHAVIRLNGVYLLPPQSRFKIEPLDAGETATEGWPVGDWKPADVRVTSSGVELLVGPEIVDNPALQPGTAVVLSVPAVDVRSEIRWPTLPVSMAPRRRAVIVSAAQRTAEAAAAKARADTEARQRAEAEDNARREAEARQRNIEERVRREDDARVLKEAHDKTQSDAARRAENAAALADNARAVAAQREAVEAATETERVQRRRLAELAAADVAREADLAAAPPRTEVLADKTPATHVVASTQINASPNETEWARAARDAAARLATAQAASQQVSVTQSVPAKAEVADPDPGRGLAKLDLVRGNGRTGEAGPAPGPVKIPAPRADVPAVSSAPHKVPATVDELPPLPRRRSSVVPFLMGMLLPLAIGAGGYYALSRNIPIPGIPVASQPAPVAAAPIPTAVATGSINPATSNRPAAQGRTQASTPAPALGDIVRIGAKSPRGRSSSGVDLTAALALADRNLHGIDQSIDREEARYWLQKALTLSLHTEQMTWAMTQLGAIYATPVAGEAPDYEKARALWEISGANGDPVAHCFIASLLEHGLGVSADRRGALKHFTEARRLGGCRGVDQAIARLSQ